MCAPDGLETLDDVAHARPGLDQFDRDRQQVLRVVVRDGDHLVQQGLQPGFVPLAPHALQALASPPGCSRSPRMKRSQSGLLANLLSIWQTCS